MSCVYCLVGSRGIISAEITGGTTSNPMSQYRGGFGIGRLCLQAHKSRNNSTLTTHIHNPPPLVPVKEYHCTHEGLAAKTLPRVSQGQLSPQFCKCRYSKLNQKTI